MRHIEFTCDAGVSGDMFAGALIDLGADFEHVKKSIISLGLHGIEVRAESVVKAGRKATKFDVIDVASGKPADTVVGHHHRNPFHLVEIIQKAGLDSVVEAHAIEIIMILARAEAKAHGVELKEVHFHEIGAVDTIVDAVAAAACFVNLGVEEASCQAIRVGGGKARTTHGILPVPTPATVEILRDFPTLAGPIERELTTPTGAALMRHFCNNPTPLDGSTLSVGYGAGSWDLEFPNVLKATLIETKS